MKHLLLISFLVFGIASCSSLSKEECQTTNWLERGKSDALRGKVTPQDSKYQKDCSEHGITMEREKYLSGYDEGLKLYCTYQNGYKLGLDSGTEHLYCNQKSIEFQKGNKLGIEVFEQNKRKAEAIKNLKKELITLNGSMECPLSQICERETRCDFNRCVHNGRQCTFNNDCKEIGQCIPVSGYTRFGQLATVNVCRFIRNY